MKEGIEDVGNIKNHYGGLYIRKHESKFYWAIEDVLGYDWEEISESLYNELKNHGGYKDDVALIEDREF